MKNILLHKIQIFQSNFVFVVFGDILFLDKQIGRQNFEKILSYTKNN